MSRSTAFNIIDPRELPAYSPSDAAAYLRVPLSTLRTWVFGYKPGPHASGGRMIPIIRIPDHGSHLLSFFNMVEAHVLASIRRDHNIPLGKIRRAVKYVEEKLKTNRPLASQKFETDGADLFVRYLGDLINVSGEGQVALEQVLRTYLKRIVWDDKGMAIRLFPYVRHGIPDADQPSSIMMDVAISGGRPVLRGTGIATKVVAERFMAGENIEDLVTDYGRPRAEIDEVLRFELKAA